MYSSTRIIESQYTIITRPWLETQLCYAGKPGTGEDTGWPGQASHLAGGRRVCYDGG
jgi:hypothetical protein